MDSLVLRAANLLRTNSGRMTTQRRVILEVLEAVGGHPTAEEIYQAARQRDSSINPSTVYRTLNWLEQVGLVNPRSLAMGRSDRRRERFDLKQPTEHHHFVCTNCGRVSEFASPPSLKHLKDKLAREQQSQVMWASITLYGLCARCAK
jgi:Fur family transcriptional regulator, ferric uptake regulator